MKRSAMPSRTKEMARTSMPPRAAPMSRSAKRLRLHRPGTARRPVVTPEERRARRLVKARSGGVCEIQVSPEVYHGRGLDFSHRVREGQGGPWSASNGLHACRGCHDWLDDNQAAARVKGWALRSTDPLDGEVMYRNRSRVVLHDDGTMTARGGGRGFDADLIIIDEAFAFTPEVETTGSRLPTLSEAIRAHAEARGRAGLCSPEPHRPHVFDLGDGIVSCPGRTIVDALQFARFAPTTGPVPYEDAGPRVADLYGKGGVPTGEPGVELYPYVDGGGDRG